MSNDEKFFWYVVVGMILFLCVFVIEIANGVSI